MGAATAALPFARQLDLLDRSGTVPAEWEKVEHLGTSTELNVFYDGY